MAMTPTTDIHPAKMLGRIYSAPLRQIDSAPLRQIDSAPLHRTGSAPLRQIDSAPLPPTDSAPLPPTDSAPLPPTDSAPLPRTDSAPLPPTDSAPSGRTTDRTHLEPPPTVLCPKNFSMIAVTGADSARSVFRQTVTRMSFRTYTMTNITTPQEPLTPVAATKLPMRCSRKTARFPPLVLSG